jgi:hypothetical protein
MPILAEGGKDPAKEIVGAGASISRSSASSSSTTTFAAGSGEEKKQEGGDEGGGGVGEDRDGGIRGGPPAAVVEGGGPAPIEGRGGPPPIDGVGPPPPIKGILKVRRCTIGKPSGAAAAGRKNAIGEKAGGGAAGAGNPPSPAGRKLFPTYEPRRGAGGGAGGGGGGGDRSIKFNSMARVLTIPSRVDLALYQRAQIWWQKSDYDEFKKTGRIISKAMECGGSEVWLTSSNAWGNRAARGAKPAGERGKSDGGEAAPADHGNKWWCKFGHSRRGLEHVVSGAEGRARQQSVLLASRMVLEEQRRQRAIRTKDPNKLRNVAMQYTSWARDLSLAAGLADAEAVSNNFDALGSPWGGCRARHFARRMRVAGGGGAGGSIAVLLDLMTEHDVAGGGGGGGPTAARTAAVVTSQILDANTHAAKSGKAKPLTTRVASEGSSSVAGKAMSLSSVADEDQPSSEGVSLKKRAKGFMPGTSGEEVASMMGGHSMGFRSVKA